MMKVTLPVFRLALLTAAVMVATGAQAAKTVGVNPTTASWIMPEAVSTSARIPQEEVRDGEYYLLSDQQVRVDAKGDVAHYSHFAVKVVNQQGLADASKINVAFDPSYESLTFHQVKIIRDGKVINKLKGSDIPVISSEPDIRDSIYEGQLTTNLLLDDVRVGDIVEYSLTRNGQNPVYAGRFGYFLDTQWSIPLHGQHFRLLWEKNTPLNLRQFNRNVQVSTIPYAGGVKYVIDNPSPPTLYTNSEAPDWFNPYGYVQFSEFGNWQGVVSWAIPLYRDAIRTDAAIQSIAQQIRSAYPSSQDQQIVAALEYVQSKIRYVGIEIGENSHRPSPASETLARRYGDCKDKVILMISILRALGVEAQPALVSTNKEDAIASYLPTINAFNHVIVHLSRQGKSVWLDPTRDSQHGQLQDIYQPDYGYALVIDANTTALTAMTQATTQHATVINDTFDVSKGAQGEGRFTTDRTMNGLDAELVRDRLAKGAQDLRGRYLTAFQWYYPKLDALQPMAFNDNTASGQLRAKGDYRVPEIWTENDNDLQYQTAFYPTEIYRYLDKPDQLKRIAPFTLSFPVNIQQNIAVTLEDKKWKFKKENFVEDNDYFHYERQVRYDSGKDLLTLSYQFQIKKKYVPADDIDSYMKARKRVIDHGEMWVVEPYPMVLRTLRSGKNTSS